MGYLAEETLIGHAALRSFLARSAQNRRHHAFLFSGPEHLGKDTVARAFVSDLLGRPVLSWDEVASHPDVSYLECAEDKKNISVAEARTFIAHFASSSFNAEGKIGVISGADDLSAEAANALLKTLEEPPGKAAIILIANRLDRLPETIKSRSASLRFLPVAAKEISDGLLRRGAAKEAAETAALASAGRPGIAIGLAEDRSAKKSREKSLSEFVGFVGAPLSARMAAAADIVSKAEAKALAKKLDGWAAIARDALHLAAGNPAAAPRDSAEAIKAYAHAAKAGGVARALRSIVAGRAMLGENVNPRLIFENIALSI